MTYYDLILKQNFIANNLRPNGFYIEAGAGDGEIISNSLYFELKYEVNYEIYIQDIYEYFNIKNSIIKYYLITLSTFTLHLIVVRFTVRTKS